MTIRKDIHILENTHVVVGIDIGKHRHAAAAVATDGRIVNKAMMIDNTRDGVDNLEKTMLDPNGGTDGILIAMEATGHYWMPLYFELERRGYRSIVINPLQTRAKFKTRIRKTKTDKHDAVSIARFVLSGDANTTRIPDESTFELRILTRRRWTLRDMAADISRYAQTLADRVFPEYSGVFCRPFIPTGRVLIREIGLSPETLVQYEDEARRVIRDASRQRVAPETIDRLMERADSSIGIRLGEKLIVDQLRSTLDLLESVEDQITAIDNTLEARVKVMDSPLCSLKLSARLIATIHAESDPIANFQTASQYAAYAGLDPSTRVSGNFKASETHISKRGSPYLREALFLAAFSLSRRVPFFKRCYARYRKKGRHHTDALVIVAHKLARVIWRMVKDNRPFKARPPKK